MPAAKRKDATPAKTKMGRPTKYSEKLNPAVSALVIRGLTDIEIAQVLGIGVRTLYDWRVAHPEFAQTLQRSKDMMVAAAPALADDASWRARQRGMVGNNPTCPGRH
jgi:hypothetical protein